MKIKFTRLFLIILIAGAGSAFAQGTKKTDPCPNAQSQAEMNDCAGRLYKSADSVLNQTYRQLVSMLDNDEKSQLKEAQTAWLKYRDLNCDFVADQYKGGTMRPMIYGFCLADVTNNRTAELKSQIKDRNQ